ncbi:MAG: hypothetical protein FK733_00450 [Asgard group archaeon]|nr:hypothetical protein [Asgard group archaeon]
MTRVTQVHCQASLVEDEDQFRIYAGTNFDIVVPKNTGPEIKFDVNDWGIVKLKLNYISEYESPTSYLSSLSQLTGKGYAFDNINWYRYGLSEASRTYVNGSRTQLDRNASIDFSVVIFNDNTTIEEFSITALQTTYLEMRISNWSYTEDVEGLALNIQSFMEGDTAEYKRLGPYVDSENTELSAFKIWHETTNFIFHFQKLIKIIMEDNSEELVLSNSFQTYNPSVTDNKPVDFWISIPYIENVKQIIFRFVCNFGVQEHTTTSLSLSFYWVITFFVLLNIPFIFLIKKRRRVRN